MFPAEGKGGPLKGASVPAQTSPTGLGDKKISDLVTPDTYVDEYGKVNGTLKYVEGWTEFSKSNKAEQSGYFFPVKLADEYEGKKIKVTGTKSKKPKEAQDREWILRVADGSITFKFETDNQEIFTLDFTPTTLQVPVGGNAVSVAMGVNWGTSCGKSEDFCKDVSIKWDGINGAVKGTFYKSNPTQKYNIPLKISDFYDKKEITIGSPATTLMWHVVLNDQNTVVTIVCEEKTIAVLTFKEAEFKETKET